MKAPKILPRVAHQAGISEALALKIWRRALSEAEYIVGQHDGSEFFGLAVERFLDQVREESDQAATFGEAGAPDLARMWEQQAQLSMIPLATARDALRYWQNAWKDALRGRKAA